MTDNEKYTPEMLEWLAERLHESIRANGKAERNRIIKDFNTVFPDIGLTIGKLSRLYLNSGGSQADFIRRYQPMAEESLEKLHAKLLRLYKDPEQIKMEPPELAKELKIKEKRLAAVNLIQAAVRGDPIENFGIRTPRGSKGTADFLEHMGYTPQFARLVERVLIATRGTT